MSAFRKDAGGEQRCGGAGEIEVGTVRDEFGNWDTETYRCSGCPDCLLPTTTTMLPVHDHDGGLYSHDPRCPGDCGPCGGMGGIPDTGPNGEMAVTCLYCGGSGQCQGCNMYETGLRRHWGSGRLRREVP